jgi:GTP-binding protein
MFIDEAKIIVSSGKGGDGVVHFRREKYINRGGPDGGDGGRGGDIILAVNRHLNTLENFRFQTVFKAEDGKRGGSKNQTGRSADHLRIELPAGTLVYENDSNTLLVDLIDFGQEYVVCKGGRGGRGNTRFATSRNQAPRLAEKGEPGEQKELKLELKLIADVGIIGMPNAGKSSLLAAVSEAKPKIGDYPFTTLVPNLGVTQLDDQSTLVLADIPGLIEGAHTGVGLGDTLLKHIQRTRVLIHLLDGLSEDPIADYSQINTELALFDPALAEKPQLVAINKIDLPDVKLKIDDISRQFDHQKVEVIPVSAATHENLKKLLWQTKKLLAGLPIIPVVESTELPVYKPETLEPQYAIKKTKNGWQISGSAIERAAAMTYWDYFASVRRFQRILEAMGIDQALQEAGIQEGDIVSIGEHELQWTQEWDQD